jgi:hypothetical protein
MLVLVNLLYAQSTISPGDPDVFAAFLRMHHAMVTSSGQTSATEASGHATISGVKVWQQDLGVTDADFGKIDAS